MVGILYTVRFFVVNLELLHNTYFFLFLIYFDGSDDDDDDIDDDDICFGVVKMFVV